MGNDFEKICVVKAMKINKTSIKFLLIIAAAFLSSGGACYQVKETPEIRANASKYVLTSCSVREQTEKGKCRFDVSCSFNTSYVMMKYKLEPPATFTFDGVPMDEKLKTSLPCEYKNTAYVLTDASGGERRDEHDLRKMNFAETEINADRTRALIIRLKDAPYPFDTQPTLVFVGKKGVNQELKTFRLPTESPNKENLPEYDSKNLTIKIPAETLKEIEGDPAKIYLEVYTGIYKKYPGYSEMTIAFSYNYKSDVVPFRLK
jgi:hypothetical protein